MQIRDVMTREVVTVGPDASVKHAGELMARRGFAALPVVDDDGRVVGVVAEADVLRDRIPQDPRQHMLREAVAADPPALTVRGVMSAPAQTVSTTADIADVSRLLVAARLRSVPVLESGVLAGIVSRRDLLLALVRPDNEIRSDLLRLVEAYTDEPDGWGVHVSEGMAAIWRLQDTDDGADHALESLARTVPGVVTVRLTDRAHAPVPPDVGPPTTRRDQTP